MLFCPVSLFCWVSIVPSSVTAIFSHNQLKNIKYLKNYIIKVKFKKNYLPLQKTFVIARHRLSNFIKNTKNCYYYKNIIILKTSKMLLTHGKLPTVYPWGIATHV